MIASCVNLLSLRRWLAETLVKASVSIFNNFITIVQAKIEESSHTNRRSFFFHNFFSLIRKYSRADLVRVRSVLDREGANKVYRCYNLLLAADYYIERKNCLSIALRVARKKFQREKENINHEMKDYVKLSRHLILDA